MISGTSTHHPEIGHLPVGRHTFDGVVAAEDSDACAPPIDSTLQSRKVSVRHLVHAGGELAFSRRYTRQPLDRVSGQKAAFRVLSMLSYAP